MMQRLRVRFTRGEEIKYISHLDITRLWERALSRAGIRIAFSEGFNPHPRLSLAAPLAVGVTAESELLDVFIDGTVTPHGFTGAVNAQLPNGIEIKDVQQVSVLLPSLQSQLNMAEYIVEIETLDGPKDIGASITALLAKETIPWQHLRDTGKREYDLRALIEDIEFVSSSSDTCTLKMQLRCGSGGSGRPEQVVKALGFKRYPVTIQRNRLSLGNQ